jgi:hypothetical protein
MRYFCLPRHIVEAIQNLPPIKEASRQLTFILKDGSVRDEVDVIGGEFYALDENKHKYFEPADINSFDQG